MCHLLASLCIKLSFFLIPIVPGKKLPIWKKRETQVNTELNELDIKHEVLTPKAYGKQAALAAAANKENGR